MARRVFRLWLRLYPRRYRERFGAEAESTWLAAWQVARSMGVRGVAGFWLSNGLDVVRSAIRERGGGSGMGDDGIGGVGRIVPARGPRGGRGFGEMRQVARSLARRPVLPLVIVATLALGVGANAVVFSLIDAVLLRPLPVRDPDTLVMAYQATSEERRSGGVSYPTYVDLRKSARSFESLSAFALMDLGVRWGELSDRVSAGLVTGDYFGTVGVGAQAGRLLEPADAAAEGESAVAVLGDGLWRRMFGADRGVVGRVVEVSGVAFTIVGIAPAGFRGTELGSAPELWLPLTMTRRVAGGGLYAQNVFETRWFAWLDVVGRLSPSSTVESAETELNVLHARIAAEHPDPFAMGTAVAEPMSVLPSRLGAVAGDRTAVVRFVAVPLAVAVLTLLIACLNVAVLLLVRASERTRELGVRTALGASRRRLVEQMLVESLLLGGAGCLAGLAVARTGPRLLESFTLPGGIRIDALGLGVDARVLGFSIVVSLFTALLFGLAPAWRAAQTEPSAALRGAGAADGVEGARVRSVLVAGQVALCLVLVVGAALFLRSVARGIDTETGIDATGVAAVSFGLAQHGYDASRGRAFLRTLLDRAGSSPGVEAVAVATHVPLGPQRTGMPVTAELAESSSGSMAGSMTAVNAVAGDYFRVFGLRVNAGRVFDARDDEGSVGVVVLNEAAAARFWPGSDPIGMRLQLVRGIGEPMTVIGVVGNAKAHGLEDDDVPYVYVSALQNPNLGVLDAVSLLVRGRSDAAAALAAGRSAISELDESLPLFDARRVQDQLDTVLMPQRFGLTLLGLFGTLALAVSSIGIYGVVACSVRQRRREMSIRAALGARPATVALALAGETFGALVIGTAVGLLGVLLLAGFLAPFLFGVGARDAVSIVGALLVLAAITTFAALLPVARTAREGGAAALRATTGA